MLVMVLGVGSRLDYCSHLVRIRSGGINVVHAILCIGQRDQDRHAAGPRFRRRRAILGKGQDGWIV